MRSKLVLVLLLLFMIGNGASEVSISDEGINVSGLVNPFIGFQFGSNLAVNSKNIDDKISISQGVEASIDDDFWNISGEYLKNESGSLVVNETELNKTIELHNSDSSESTGLSSVLSVNNTANKSINFSSKAGLENVEKISFGSKGKDFAITQENLSLNSVLANIRALDGSATIHQVEAPSGGEEATLALMRGVDKGAPEFLDIFTMNYGNPYHGLRVQSRGSGQLRPFKFQFNDGSGVYDVLEINPSGNLTVNSGSLRVKSGDIHISGSQYIGNSEIFAYGANSNNLVIRGGNTDTSVELQVKERDNQILFYSPLNSQIIFQADADGGIRIPSGDLDLSGNNITDSTGGNITMASSLKVYGKSYTTGADLAEIYSSPENLRAGQLVSINDEKDDSVVKTTKKFDDEVLGVISTDPSQIMNYREDGYPVALEGKVKVNMKEGINVNRGDRIVPSSLSGKATTCEVLDPVENREMELRKLISHNQKCTSSTVGRALENGDSEILVKLD